MQEKPRETRHFPLIITKYPQLAKVAVWGLLFLTLYYLRSFFLLIFLTFLFSFLQYRVGDFLKRKGLQNRRARTWLVGAMFLLGISVICYFLGTEGKKQTKLFVYNFDSYITALDNQVNKLSSSMPMVAQIISDMEMAAINNGSYNSSPTILILQQVFDLSAGESANIKKNFSRVFVYSGKIIGITSYFLLSLLFSFLIILDFSRLSYSFSKLEKSRIAFIFQEVIPGIVQFSRILGKAFEAQFFIALLNCTLTGVGLFILGIHEYSVFLIAIVFFCSFIPIAGVFISSVPICMIALQSGGLYLMAFAVGFIIIIHMIEAYILNPRIYGSHLQINPVIVLVILTVFGKLFGVWGFLLGVPICTWFIQEIIYPLRKISQGDTVVKFVDETR